MYVKMSIVVRGKKVMGCPPLGLKVGSLFASTRKVDGLSTYWLMGRSCLLFKIGTKQVDNRLQSTMTQKLRKHWFLEPPKEASYQPTAR